MTKILHLAYSDAAGVPSRWAAAHREAGAEARVLCEVDNQFGYGDIEFKRWSDNGRGNRSMYEQRVHSHFEWAEALMVYDHPFYLEMALLTKKPVFFRALGTAARENSAQLKELLPQTIRATAETADLALQFGIPLTGSPYIVPEEGAVPEMPPRLIHAPADGNTHGTDFFVKAANDTGWALDVIRNTSNKEVLRLKRKASVLVDKFQSEPPYGYGVNSIEAMSLGLPAIARASGDVADVLRVVGSPVVRVGSVAELHEALIMLRSKDKRERIGSAGIRFVQMFHDGALRAQEDLALL